MKVFQIRQDDRFAWYETDQEQMERMVNVCGWQGRVLELASTTTADAVSVTAAELSCVINWLEGGRDPKDAAKELRLYRERAAPVAAPVAGQEPVGVLEVFKMLDGKTIRRLVTYAAANEFPLGNYPLYTAAPVPAASVQPDSGRDAALGVAVLRDSLQSARHAFSRILENVEGGTVRRTCTEQMQSIHSDLAKALILAAHPANVAQVGEEQIITQRDAFHDVADNLANAIAAHFGVDIGEHSSVNCPWDEALRVIEEAGQVGELSADVILGYAREVGILGPVSDGNALKYARLVLAAAKKGQAT